MSHDIAAMVREALLANIPKENAPAATEAASIEQQPVESVPAAQTLGNWGATSGDWMHFDLVLGLGGDLLPVVSNPTAEVWPDSKIKEIGKTPSRYNQARKVVGIAGWTSYQASDSELARWATEPDYGICLQTRTVRGLDIDVPDESKAQAITDFVAKYLRVALPARYRLNSGKVLLAFALPGEMAKRKMVVDGGIVEFLATGQQFVAAGTHPSGTRYEWAGGLPCKIPTLGLDKFEALWTALGECFATEPPSVGKVSMRKRGDYVALHDPVADYLYALGLVLGESRGGALLVACPWEAEHTSGTQGDSSTVWFPAGTNGHQRGNFKCLHAHCDGRGNREFFEVVGYVEDVLADFDALDQDEPTETPHHAFFAYLPAHQYLHRPTRAFWPAASVDGHLAYKIEGKKVSTWLDRYRAVQQATWHPAHGELLKDVVVADGGFVPRPGALVYNRYRPPVIMSSGTNPAPWLDHLRAIYPGEAAHLIKWFAHRIQHPGEKINHALVLGGSQGIGKDTILEPVRRGVGPWNWADIDPKKLTGAFNPFVESVVLRINEVRDLGDLDRFAFYDHSKTYIAAPPDVLMCNNKHAKEYPVFNVMGVILTTNHKTNGIYLPMDDRRHYVAWSEARKEDFDDQHWRDLWDWLNAGGAEAVVGYLRGVDLSDFNPKAPPPKTDAFFAIVQANANPDDVALAGITIGDDGTKLPVVTLDILAAQAMEAEDNDLVNALTDSKNRRRVPHMMERAGYVPVRNPDAKDGLWKIGGRRQVVYADSVLSLAERVKLTQVHVVVGR